MQTKLSKYECKYKEIVLLLIQQIKFTGFSLCFIYSSKDLSLDNRLVQPKLLAAEKMPRRTAGHTEEIPLSRQAYGIIHLCIKNTLILTIFVISI